jgi:hypothetical protein
MAEANPEDTAVITDADWTEWIASDIQQREHGVDLGCLYREWEKCVSWNDFQAIILALEKLRLITHTGNRVYWNAKAEDKALGPAKDDPIILD